MTQPAERPLIAVTSNTEERSIPYADVVERGGGTPWTILPDRPPPPEEVLARVGGLLITGGEDVHPRRYGRQPDPGVALWLNEARDDLEIPLLQAALEADMPVLCICRGTQVLNVAMGGGLIQEVPGHNSFEQDGQRVSSYHRIYIAPGSKLAAIVGSGGFVRVNSRHHQGIREAQKSRSLLASAYSQEDGIIEGLESPDHSWVIGVQFHPERRNELPPHFQRLFQSLVERAREYSNTGKSQQSGLRSSGII